MSELEDYHHSINLLDYCQDKKGTHLIISSVVKACKADMKLEKEESGPATLSPTFHSFCAEPHKMKIKRITVIGRPNPETTRKQLPTH